MLIGSSTARPTRPNMSCLARYEAIVLLMAVSSICQRAVVCHSISPAEVYGGNGSGNRPVRTRLLGWCGGWGRKTPGYPIGSYNGLISERPFLTSQVRYSSPVNDRLNGATDCRRNGATRKCPKWHFGTVSKLDFFTSFLGFAFFCFLTFCKWFYRAG